MYAIAHANNGRKVANTELYSNYENARQAIR